MSTETLNEVFYHTREFPAHWRDSLRAVDPIREGLSYLEPFWHKPSQRWVLYNMVPIESYRALDRELFWAEVNGPDPQFLPPDETFLSSVQWKMWQTHKRIAEPCWVLQGTKGGHLVRYNLEYQAIAKAEGLPSSPPRPGDLCYAPWDARASRRIQQMNRLLQAGMDLDLFMRQNSKEGMKQRKKDAMKAYRAQVVKWLGESDEQLQAEEHYLRAMKTGELEVRHDADAPDWAKEEEKAVANYIETGSPSGYTDIKTT